MWVDDDWMLKTWVADWNPYESDADAVMALQEWATLHKQREWTLRSFGNYHLVHLVQYGSGGEKAIKGTMPLRHAITTALEEWGDATTDL
jgi:hypothetical protein